MYTTVLFSLTGGNLLRWFRDQWGQAEVAEAAAAGADPYDLLMRAMAAEPTDLLVLPYFTPSGTPYFDAHMPGAILGLRLATTRGQVLRALVEGVAMEMRLNLEILQESGLAVRQLRAIGGGAKQPDAGATEGRRARPPDHDAGRDRGRLPGRGNAGLCRPHGRSPRRTGGTPG